MNLESAISSAVGQIRRGVEAQYEDRFNEEKGRCHLIGMISVVAIIGSIASGILGFSVAAPTGIAAYIGASLIGTSLASGYLGYNFFRISRNMLDILRNHSAYRTLGVGYFDRQRVVNRIGSGTFLCNWAVELMADCFTR